MWEIDSTIMRRMSRAGGIATFAGMLVACSIAPDKPGAALGPGYEAVGPNRIGLVEVSDNGDATYLRFSGEPPSPPIVAMDEAGASRFVVEKDDKRWAVFGVYPTLFIRANGQLVQVRKTTAPRPDYEAAAAASVAAYYATAAAAAAREVSKSR